MFWKKAGPARQLCYLASGCVWVGSNENNVWRLPLKWFPQVDPCSPSALKCYACRAAAFFFCLKATT